MDGRYGGMLRDLWWLILIIVLAGIVIGIFVNVLIGLIIAGMGIVVPAYFATMRYDASGKERDRGPM